MNSLTRKEAILTMLESEPADEFLNYALAIEFEKEGNNQDAINTLVKLKLYSPNYLGMYLKLAELYVNQGNIDEATKTATEGIVLARKKNDKKTEGELNVLLMEIEE